MGMPLTRKQGRQVGHELVPGNADQSCLSSVSLV
jgi:hypothetical protein